MKRQSDLNQNDLLNMEPAQTDLGAMSVFAPESEDSVNAVPQNGNMTAVPQLNPNVQTFVSPSTPKKKNEKKVLEVTFTAYPKEGTLDGVDLLGDLTQLLNKLGVKMTNLSIRTIDKKM